MALSIKPGVIFTEIHSAIVAALPKIDRIYSKFGQIGVITSARDGEHMGGSKHYTGEALDLRSFYFNGIERQEIHFELRNALGADYDVVLEKDHFHVEFDP